MISTATHTAAAREDATITSDSTAKNSPRAAHTIGKIIFIIALAVIPVFSLPYGTTRPIWQAAFEFIIFALGVAWIVQGAIGGKWFVPEHRVLLPLVSIAAFAYLQTIISSTYSVAGVNQIERAISADPYETKRFIWRLFALVLFAALLYRFAAESRKRMWLLIGTIIGVGTFIGLFGLLRQTTNIGLEEFMPVLDEGSSYAQFVNRNHFAFLMEMVFGLCLGFIVSDIKRERALIFVAAVAPVWLALVLSNSRGGILGMLGAILVVMLLWNSARGVKPGRHRVFSDEEFQEERQLPRRAGLVRVARIFAGAVLLVVVVVGVVRVGGEQLVSRVETVREEFGANINPETETEIIDRTGSRRADIWRSTAKLIAAHPFVGSGYGAYSIAITGHHDASGAMGVLQAHNDYLELLAAGGLVGAGLFVWFVVVFIIAARKKLRQAKDAAERGAGVGAIAGIVAVAVHSIVEFGLHTTINAMVLMTLIAIATMNWQLNEVGIARRRKLHSRRG